MAKYSVEILSKEFSDEDSKSAYLKACKWLAKNVYSKDFSKNIQTQIIKKNTKVPAFKLSVFACIDYDVHKKDLCEQCRMIKRMFYCTEIIDCTECKFSASDKQLEKELKQTIDFLRDKLV